LRIFVRSIVESQGKGGEAAEGLCDSEGVYFWGRIGMWGMRFCEKWAFVAPGRESFLFNYVTSLLALPSLGFPFPGWNLVPNQG
jgi:hypothetical protein